MKNLHEKKYGAEGRMALHRSCTRTQMFPIWQEKFIFCSQKKKGVEPSREKICKKYFDETRTSTLLFLKIDKWWPKYKVRFFKLLPSSTQRKLVVFFYTKFSKYFSGFVLYGACVKNIKNRDGQVAVSCGEPMRQKIWRIIREKPKRRRNRRMRKRLTGGEYEKWNKY